MTGFNVMHGLPITAPVSEVLSLFQQCLHQGTANTGVAVSVDSVGEPRTRNAGLSGVAALDHALVRVAPFLHCQRSAPCWGRTPQEAGTCVAGLTPEKTIWLVSEGGDAGRGCPVDDHIQRLSFAAVNIETLQIAFLSYGMPPYTASKCLAVAASLDVR